MGTLDGINSQNFSITQNGRYEPWELQVSRGQISFHSTVSIFGYQSTVGTTFIPVWENTTTYSYPASAVVMTLASSSASDAGVSVLISGLDANYLQISETITFTAGNYTGVNTTNSYLRINSMTVTAVPTAGTSNIGTITAKNGGTTYAQIAIGVGRTQMSIYTVPANNTFYLYRTQGFTNTPYTTGAYVTYRTYQVSSSGVQSLITQRPYISNFTVERRYPNLYAEKTDIQWQMQASSGTTAAIGFTAEGVLVKNNGTL